MNEIKLNSVGQILTGDNLGWYILIEHDPESTGGYYIYQAPIIEVKSSSQGFDDWLEKFEDINDYFEESGWRIKWL